MNKKVKNKSFSNCSLFPKNRKGTHVEVIISFVIFISFVFFIFAASKYSIMKQEGKKDLFSNLENGLIEEFSSGVKVISVAISPPTGSCVTLSGHSINSLDIGNRIIIVDSEGNVLDSSRVYINGAYISIDGLSSQDTFFKIYYSEEFNQVSGGGGGCTNVDEEIGLVKTDKYVFQEKIESGVDDGDYSALKTKLDVPGKTEFTYGIILSNGELIEKTHPDLESDISTNIYVRDKPIKYIDSDGKINSGYLKIKVW